MHLMMNNLVNNIDLVPYFIGQILAFKACRILNIVSYTELLHQVLQIAEGYRVKGGKKARVNLICIVFRM